MNLKPGSKEWCEACMERIAKLEHRLKQVTEERDQWHSRCNSAIVCLELLAVKYNTLNKKENNNAPQTNPRD